MIASKLDPQTALSIRLNRSHDDSGPVPFVDKSTAESIPAIELLAVPEVAEFLNISVSSVRRLLEGRRIPFVKVGGSIRVAKADILSYLATHRVEAADQ